MNDTKVISVSCQKGGVGKTLVSLNLSYALSKLGYKVLLIDMDPQASASLLLNIDIGDDEMPGIASIFEYVMYCLKERAEIDPDILKKCINRPTYTIPVRKNKTYVSENVEFGFDLIPSSIELANYDILLNNFDIAGMKFGGYVMQQIIKVFKKNFDYDFNINSYLYNQENLSDILSQLIRTTFIPKKNHNDLDNIPEEVKKKISIIEVNNFIEVYNNIFG